MKKVAQAVRNLEKQQKHHAAKVVDVLKDTNRRELTARAIQRDENQVNKLEKGKSVTKMTTAGARGPPVSNKTVPVSDEANAAITTNCAANAQKRYGYKPFQDHLRVIENNRFLTSRQKKELRELKCPNMFLSKPKNSN